MGHTKPVILSGALVLCTSLGIAACSALGPARSPGPAYFMASDSTRVMLIQWNAPSGGLADGTITYDSISTSGTDSSAPDALSVQSDPIMVTINSDQVTITGFLSINLTGTLNSDGSLTVTTPPDSSTGQIQTGTLSPADPSSYNAAVAALNETISQDNAQAARQQAQSQQQEQAAAAQQDSANRKADAKAQAACNQFGGSWTPPGSVDYSAEGYTSSITDGPQHASCDNVSYLGIDDATYYLTVYFSSTGTVLPPGDGTGTATASECQHGYYPDQSAGQTSQQPGHWSSILGICLP